MYKQYIQYISTLQDSVKYRTLTLPSQLSSVSYLDFSSNDYLGLSKHPEMLKAAHAAGNKYGLGATGSRLLSGNNELFESFEARIAEDKNMESALIFNTGFQANAGVLSALLDPKVLHEKPIVFFDRLNHASLYQAIFLTQPELVRYNHNDMDHLLSLLIKYRDDNRPKFIVAETLFGMDGDILPLEQVVSLAKEHQAFLYLDEAHATGIYGSNGYGISTDVDLTGVPCIIMGTFSKALGGSGGYIACDQILKNYLINKVAGFIYSTANSPMVIGGVSKAWEMIKDLKEEREHILSLSIMLKQKLVNLGFNIGNSSSHIIPIIVEKEKLAIEAKEKLLQKGIIVSCIRPPTVSPNSSRLRIALSAKHTNTDVEKLVQILSTIL